MSIDSDKPPQQACTIDHVKKFIYENADQELDRAQLANMMGYSVPHFHRIFTAEVGESITAYIRRVRLEHAATKLITGAVDLTQIAIAAGYQSQTAFGKAFKQYFSYTPNEFRKLRFISDLQKNLHTDPGETQMRLIPNLTFNGNCREALAFYAELFNGELGVFLPWDSETIARVPEATEEHVMNGSITISGQTVLGSDQFGEMYLPAGNISLMIEIENVTDAQTKFASLAEGGQIFMPFGETFWAEGYGFCMDRFGILWQINCIGSKGQAGQA